MTEEEKKTHHENHGLLEDMVFFGLAKFISSLNPKVGHSPHHHSPKSPEEAEGRSSLQQGQQSGGYQLGGRKNIACTKTQLRCDVFCIFRCYLGTLGRECYCKLCQEESHQRPLISNMFFSTLRI